MSSRILQPAAMKTSAVAILVFATALAALAQDQNSTIKVDVKLVNVFVTVTDDRGTPVAGLKKENFSLQEDGREQKIAVFDRESALPLSIVMAVDTSLSTSNTYS